MKNSAVVSYLHNLLLIAESVQSCKEIFYECSIIFYVIYFISSLDTFYVSSPNFSLPFMFSFKRNSPINIIVNEQSPSVMN